MRLLRWVSLLLKGKPKRKPIEISNKSYLYVPSGSVWGGRETVTCAELRFEIAIPSHKKSQPYEFGEVRYYAEFPRSFGEMDVGAPGRWPTPLIASRDRLRVMASAYMAPFRSIPVKDEDEE